LLNDFCTDNRMNQFPEMVWHLAVTVALSARVMSHS
jgi:hypothetical protein